MLLAIVQALFKFALNLGVIVGLAFMIACTVFVSVCIIRGDVKISIVRNKVEEETE